MSHLQKQINGKTFNFSSREFNLDFAKIAARKQKEQGFYTRIIPSLGNYVVYVCKK